MNTTSYSISSLMYERSGDNWESLLEGIRQSFKESVSDTNYEPLFTTNAYHDLHEVFLNNLPYSARQYYNCRACNNFIDRYGDIVRIDDNGNLEPVMWKYAPEFFKKAVEAVRENVKSSRVTGLFLTSEKTLGIPEAGGWDHLYINVPNLYVRTKSFYSIDQVSAEKLEDFKMIQNAVNKYSIETVETAVNLLRSDSMYRGEKILGIAEWFLEVLHDIQNNPKRANILWKKVATAPAGFCHVSSSMIGTLLDDISEGMSFGAVQRRFNEKMNPLKYQRPQVAPSAGNVARAEKIVAELGLENSLKRRFARLDEIETIWKPREKKSIPVSGGVFSDIKTKESAVKKTENSYISKSTMTWVKFQRVVLPNAKKIELHIIPSTKNSYAALVTAEDLNAAPIICWDTEEHRNPVTWYLYAGGSTPSHWNLNSSTYVEVTGITLQPNMWQPGHEHHGEGVFFILEGCKDVANTSSALFPEHMRGELREVRSTIEAYSKQHELGGYEEASACGLLLQAHRDSWKCKLRVTTDVGVSEYTLDRWD